MRKAAQRGILIALLNVLYNKHNLILFLLDSTADKVNILCLFQVLFVALYLSCIFQLKIRYVRADELLSLTLLSRILKAFVVSSDQLLRGRSS